MELKKRIDKFVSNTLLAIIILMVLNVFWQFFTRFLLQNPSSFTDELARYLMIWLGVLGIAYISGRNLNIVIDLFPNKWNSYKQKSIKKTINIIVIVGYFVAFLIGGIRMVYRSITLDQKSIELQIPMAFVYLIIPLSGLLIMYYKIFDLLKK